MHNSEWQNLGNGNYRLVLDLSEFEIQPERAYLSVRTKLICPAGAEFSLNESSGQSIVIATMQDGDGGQEYCHNTGYKTKSSWSWPPYNNKDGTAWVGNSPAEFLKIFGFTDADIAGLCTGTCPDKEGDDGKKTPQSCNLTGIVSSKLDNVNLQTNGGGYKGTKDGAGILWVDFTFKGDCNCGDVPAKQ